MAKKGIIMKRIKLLLISINIILFIFIYLTFNKKTVDDERETIRKITNLTKLTEIRISNSSGDLKISKKNYNWIIEHPIKWEINNFAMSNFLTVFSHLKIKSLFNTEEIQSRGEMLDDYGIGSYSTVLTLKKSNQSLTFKIGKNTRDEKSVYCGIKLNTADEYKIYRVSREIKDLLDRSFTEWADSTLANISIYKLNKISSTFKSVNGSMFETSLNQINKQWEFNKPFTAKANNEEVRLLLNRLLSEQIKDYCFIKDANQSQLDLENNWKVKLQLSSDDKDLIFYINDSNDSQENNTLLCKSNFSDHIFEIDQTFLTSLSDWSTKLRERRIVRVQEDSIKEIEITNQFTSFKLSNQVDRNWVVSNDNNYTTKADIENIQLFLNRLNSFKIKEFISFNPSHSEIHRKDIDSHYYELKIKHKNTNQQTILIKSNDNDASLWKTLLIEESLLCLVEDDWSKILNKREHDFKNRIIFDKDDLITNFSISDFENNNTLFQSDSNNTNHSDIFENLKVKTYLGNESKDDGTWNDGDWVPWKYKINVKYIKQSLPGEQLYKQFYLSELIENQGWIGNFDNDIHTFLASVEMVENIMMLTRKDN
jgi:hypothetical protein